MGEIVVLTSLALLVGCSQLGTPNDRSGGDVSGVLCARRKGAQCLSAYSARRACYSVASSVNFLGQ